MRERLPGGQCTRQTPKGGKSASNGGWEAVKTEVWASLPCQGDKKERRRRPCGQQQRIFQRPVTKVLERIVTFWRTDTTLVEVGQPAKHRAAMHAIGQRQIRCLHASLGRFNRTKPHGFERGVDKLAGIGPLVGGHASTLRK